MLWLVKALWVCLIVYGYSFIQDAERIASNDYQPTDDDVIRARLRTLGVQEYRFVFDHGELTFSANQYLVK